MVKMTPVEVYKTYISLKNHFTKEDYDYLKYHGKVRASESAFYKRKDRFWFEKVSRQKKDDEIVNFFIANFALSDDPQQVWIGEIIKNGDQKYLDWQRKVQSLSYIFKEEIDPLFSKKNFNDMFFIVGSKHPKLLKLFLKKEISIESMIILNKILNYKKDFDSKLDDPVWQLVSNKIAKYSPFLNIDVSKFKEILKKIVINK